MTGATPTPRWSRRRIAMTALGLAGAIDRDKFVQAHRRRGAFPDWVADVLDGRPRSVILGTETAPSLPNLL